MTSPAQNHASPRADDLQVETRPCGDCKNFKDMGIGNKPDICTKKLMAVLSDMHVTFHASKGTCFEPKP